MPILVPDTNFLIYLVKYKLLDELRPYKLVILEQVVEELRKLSKDKKTKIEDRTAAVVAGMFLRNTEITVEREAGKADDAILKVAQRLDAMIGTMDKELTTRAKKLDIAVIKIRQKKYLK